MEISRETVRLTVIITGILVLASYIFGVWRMDDARSLWGGIPESWRTINTSMMFVAATGFLIAWWILLYYWEPAVVEQIQWPMGQGTDGGYGRLLLAFMLITIPSMFWLETVILHQQMQNSWTQWLVIGNLWLACTGNLLLGLLAYSAWQSDIASYAVWPLIGSLMLSLQIVLNDGILWVLKYPW